MLAAYAVRYKSDPSWYRTVRATFARVAFRAQLSLLVAVDALFAGVAIVATAPDLSLHTNARPGARSAKSATDLFARPAPNLLALWYPRSSRTNQRVPAPSSRQPGSAYSPPETVPAVPSQHTQTRHERLLTGMDTRGYDPASCRRGQPGRMSFPMKAVRRWARQPRRS